VHGRVLVALLETVVLLDIVQVVLTDDDGVLHLGGLDHASDQLATDVHIACEQTNGTASRQDKGVSGSPPSGG